MGNKKEGLLEYIYIITQTILFASLMVVSFFWWLGS